MNTRKLLLASASVLAIGAAQFQAAKADSDPCVGSGVLSGVCTNYVSMIGDLTVTGSVVGPNAVITNISGYTFPHPDTVTLSNSGLISNSDGPGFLNLVGLPTTTLVGGSVATIYNSAVLNNTGTIAGTWSAVENDGTITALNNLGGTIIGTAGSGITNTNVINTLTNTGRISGFFAGVAANAGTLSSLINSGVITANSTIAQTGVGISEWYTVNTVTSDPSTTIISVTTGAIERISNTGTISGSAGGISGIGYFGTITNAGVITADLGPGIAIYEQSVTAGSISTLFRGTLGSLINQGLINGIYNKEYILGLTNTGKIAAGNGPAAIGNFGTLSNVINSGVIESIHNEGTISGSIAIDQTFSVLADGGRSVGTIGSIENLGTIVAASTAIGGFGSIGTLTNSGKILGAGYSVKNGIASVDGTIITGSIGSIANSGTLAGLQNAGNIGTISNSGLVNGSGILNQSNTVGSTVVLGTIAAILNSGVIMAENRSLVSGSVAHPYGITNNAVIGTIVNDGVLFGGTLFSGGTVVGVMAGLYNNGTIGGFTNNLVTNGIYNSVKVEDNAFVQGTLGSFVNTGTVTGEYGSTNFGVIGTILNQGTIGRLGTIAGFTNSVASTTATINGASSLIWASGVIGALRNEGQIYGIYNSGTIHSLTNTGALLAYGSGSAGLSNTGAIDTLANAGTVDAVVNGFQYWSRSAPGGSIIVTRFQNGEIGQFDNSGAVGKLDNTGTIGTLVNSGTIAGTNYGLANSLIRPGISIAGSDPFQPGTIVEAGLASGFIGTLLNTGLISGVRAIENNGNYNEGASIGLLRNDGTILSVIPSPSRNEGYGIDNGGTIGTLLNNGTIAALCDLGSCLGIGSDTGTIGTLINAGLISAVSGDSNVWGIVSWGTPIGQLTNSGTISVSGTSATAIKADDPTGGIGVLTNSGMLSATGTDIAYGIFLGGSCGAPCGSTIGSLNNSGTMTASAPVSAIVVYNGAGSTITSFVNDGSIKVVGTAGSSGPQYGVVNVGSLVALTNNGVIGGDARIGIVNIGIGSSLAGTVYQQNSTISTLVNVGAITGSEVGISNGGQINVLSNTGTIAAAGNSAVRGLYNSGTITGLTNGGLIAATGQDAIGLWNDRGSIASFVNNGTVRSGSGTVLGGATAIWNYGGAIDSLTNNGTIAANGSGNSLGIYNNNSGTLIARIGTLTNAGAIAVSGKSSAAIFTEAGSAITKIVNTGMLSADPVEATSNVIWNSGSIGEINNSGTIQGANAITSAGTLGTITNSGVISGNVTSATDLVIAGGTTTSGTFKNGIITAPSVSFSAGSLTLADNIVVGNGTGMVTNAGATLSISSAVSITGNYTQTAGSLQFVDSGELLVSGQANLSGGTVALASTVNYLAGTTVTLVGAASGSSYNGVTVTLTGVDATADTTSTKDLVITVANNYVGGTIGTVSNGGTLNSGTVAGIVVGQTGTVGSASNTGTIVSDNVGVDNSGQLGTLTNTGVLSAGNVGVGNLGSIGTLANEGTITGTNTVVSNTGTLGTLVNGGVLTGAGIGVGNSGSIASLDNSGTIIGGDTVVDNSGSLGSFSNGGVLSGSGTGLSNTGTIGTIGNTGTIAMSGGAYGLNNAGTVGGVTNDGTITGGERDVYNQGAMGSLVNNGHIGSTYAVYIDTTGSLGQFVNGGNIEGTIAAFYNAGTVGTISNSGTITGDGLDAIFNQGTLGLISNSGTITGTGYAIRSNGTLGPIVNTGLVIGNVSATNPLSISGGTGVTGTFTGGTITAANVNFTSGSLLVNDAVVGDVVNSGASLQLGSAAATITGGYAQSAGSLDLSTIGVLTVSGAANVTGGTIISVTAATGNYLAGGNQVLIHAGAASAYTGMTVNLAAPSQLANVAATSGNDLVVNYLNDYVGGSLAAIANTGTVSGHAYAVYVAAGGDLAVLNNTGNLSGSSYAVYAVGNLGRIANAGVISGNIASARPLSLSGGSSGFGTFTGGTITAPSVAITAGAVRLGDAINVGAGTVSVSGATIEVADRVAITGNYVQTGGALVSDVASTTAFGQLAVSGSATITGTTITLAGSMVKAGQTYTIVDASAASSYTGDTVKVVGAHYKAILSVTADDLIATIRPLFSDIGVAKGGDAATMGRVLEGLGDVTAMQKSIDTLSNLSDTDLGTALEQAAPAQVGNGQATLRRAVLTSGMIGDAIDRRVNGIDRNVSGSTTWLSVLGGYASRDASGGTQGYDTTAVGVVAGWDHLAADGLRLGVAASWTDARNTAQGEVSANFNRADSYQLTGYTAWSEGAWLLNTRALVGYDTYKQRRVMSTIGETATGDYAGYHYGWSAEGSYAYDLGYLSIAPTAAFNWLRVSVNSYTESGAKTDNLSLPSYFADSVEGLLGLKFGATYKSEVGTFLPEVKLSWVHDFTGGKAATRAVLGGTSFEMLADPIAKDGAKVEAGLGLFGDRGVSVWIGYDGDLRRDYRAHTGDVRIQYRF